MTILLYDLCGADDLRFSPYCFRAKMALALKGIAYETIPVPFTGIAEIGRGSFRTVPVMVDGEQRVGDSFAIAEHLEARHQGAPLFPLGDAGRAAARFVEGLMNGLVQPAISPLIGADIHRRLQPVDHDYFRNSREHRFGRTLEAAQAERTARLPDVRRLLIPLRHALRDRPFLGGERPMFIDAIPFGTIAWTVAIGMNDLIGDDPVMAPWFDRCRTAAGLASTAVA
ncbi:MAG TPA: glutathione S-transferase N-terminal domain-containing protein [Methylomirabilota bacterium]|nr:glutathione S-transferase N-terminal domain-containing protein [Methylomirabilota bacterium]